MDKSFFVNALKQLSTFLSKDTLNNINTIIARPVEKVPKIQTYKPDYISVILYKIKQEKSVREFTISQKVLVLGFIEKNYAELTAFKFESLLELAYQAYLQRMFKVLLDEQYVFDFIDVFWKELAVARLQFFPLTSGVAEFYSGFGIKQGLSINPVQTVKFLKVLLFNGKKPYYRIHIHTPQLSKFTEENWIESYKQVAIMLKRNSTIKGLLRASWFFDPRIKTISPHLGYLHDLPKVNGAKLFRIGVDDSGNAISTSKSRRKLYEEGHYVPTNYLLVWSRGDIIKWFDAQE
jgi:hypothetical protein